MTRDPRATTGVSPDAQALLPPGQRGGHRITVERVVEGEAVQRFYSLYVDAFAPLRTEAVARHVLREDEFLEEMVNPLVDKYVAWDGDGRAVAMATLTRHLETVPWIEPEYFAHRFPDIAARNAVFYLGFILVERGRRRNRLFSEITEAVIRRTVEARGVCGWDICAFNNRTVGLSEVVKALSDSVAPIDVEVLDTQTYYCGIPEVSRPANVPSMRQQRNGGW